jgi:sigma-B regulation protein RsbU (phosphoserine phosphatase)
MTMARILLRVGLQATHSPAEAVKQVNAGLTDDLSNAGMLLTLFAATFDPVSRQLSAMNCGHGPVLVHRHGATEVWEADGPPVGMLPQLMSVERTLTLDRHDILVVMSDGFSEARDAQGKRVGIAPLVETLQRAAAGDAAVIAAAFQDVVAVGEGGAAAEDDQTLIVLKVE